MNGSRLELGVGARSGWSCWLVAGVLGWGMGLIDARGEAAAQKGTPRSAWEVQIGPSWRTGNRVDARWDPAAVIERVQGEFVRQAGGGDMPPQTGYADRNYEDGFVYVDPGTADPETDVPGLTWYWGYQNSDQYAGDSVVFHGSSFQERRVEPLDVSPWADDEKADWAGIDLTVGRKFWQRGSIALGVSGGLNWSPGDTFDFSVQRAIARETTVVRRPYDVYAAPYLPFPDAPYEGAYDGPGYLLSNEPDIRGEETLSRSSRDWTAESTLEVDVEVLDLRIGPSLWLALHDRIDVRLTPQVRAARVAHCAETWTTLARGSQSPASYGQEEDGDDWIWGGGVEAEIRFHLGRGWHLGLAAASDWWSEEVEIAAEPFALEVDLGQWSCSAKLGLEF